MKRITLLSISHNYPRYEGDFAGVFLHLLLKSLPEHGIDPIVLAPHDTGAAEYEEIDGVRVFRFRYADREEDQVIAYRGQMHKLVLGSVSGMFQFRRFLERFRAASLDIIRKEKVDIIAGHWLIPAGMVMKSLVKKTGLPSIMSSHGTDVRLMRKYAGATYRYLRPFCRNLATWTFVSRYLRDEIMHLDPYLEPILEVLPMPHDESIFRINAEVQREENLIVAVTRFTEQKRVDQLIRAVALLDEQGLDFRLEIYGEGASKPQIEELMSRLGLNERVLLKAPIPQKELAGVYNRAAIVVLNSVNEGFGLALSEAMLCGAAVIGARSGGITDIIENEVRGLLVEPDNHSTLSEAIARLLRDRETRLRMSEAGHEYARQHFASKASSSRYAEIIRQAAGA